MKQILDHARTIALLLYATAMLAVGVGAWRLTQPVSQSGAVESTATATLIDAGRSICADIRRVVAPAMARTQKLAQDPQVIAALIDGTRARQTKVCNTAISASTEIDAVALFNSAGKITAINTIYASGEPIPQDRVDRILGLGFDHRNIIQQCVRNKSSGSILEFQTTCDITPALFNSTGLSVAYSVPVFDPKTGQKLGVVSSRLRFDRLFDLIKGRIVAGTSGRMQFVTDQGKYFSEEINSGREKPPIESSALASIVAPLVAEKSDYSFSRHNGDYLGLFRLQDFNTLDGGGIQIMLIVGEAWVAGEARQERLLRAGSFIVIGILLALFAALLGTIASARKLQTATDETRRRLDMALDSGGLGFWDWDLKSDVVCFDKRFGEQLGLGTLELAPLFAQWMCRIHPDDVDAKKNAIARHLEGREPVYVNQHRVRHADGSWRWISSSGKVVSRAADGTPLRMVGTHLDITQRKATESQLVQAQKLESIGQLAAGIAHEINTPTQYANDNMRFLQEECRKLLTLVDSYTNQLASSAPASTWKQREADMLAMAEAIDLPFLRAEIPVAITQSLEGMQRIATIVRALKDFSHPGSDSKEPADLNRAITTTLEVCRARWKLVADLETDLAGDLPAVPCFVTEFNQVILNLVVNAADAIAESVGPDGPKKGLLRITSRVFGDDVEIRISDNGSGIPEAIKNRMFEQFFTTKPVGKGTGQGLALCRNVIVNKHGGTLCFESIQGVGTTFVIRLPLAIKAQPQLEAA